MHYLHVQNLVNKLDSADVEAEDRDTAVDRYLAGLDRDEYSAAEWDSIASNLLIDEAR